MSEQSNSPVFGAAGEDAPIDRSLAGWLQNVNDLVKLREWGNGHELEAWRGFGVGDVDRRELDEDGIAELELLERLELTVVPLHPTDLAHNLADALVYDTTILGRKAQGDDWEVTGVELLLGGGGPTVEAMVKFVDGQPDELVYSHSWGEEVDGREVAAMRTVGLPWVLDLMGELLGMLGMEL